MQCNAVPSLIVVTFYPGYIVLVALCLLPLVLPVPYRWRCAGGILIPEYNCAPCLGSGICPAGGKSHNIRNSSPIPAEPDNKKQEQGML